MKVRNLLLATILFFGFIFTAGLPRAQAIDSQTEPSYLYNRVGLVSVRTYPTGISTRYLYDSSHQLISVTHYYRDRQLARYSLIYNSLNEPAILLENLGSSQSNFYRIRRFGDLWEIQAEDGVVLSWGQLKITNPMPKVLSKVEGSEISNLKFEISKQPEDSRAENFYGEDIFGMPRLVVSPEGEILFNQKIPYLIP
ncbi:hypothetical protein A3A70_00655 [candidate division WWE3 bacterium RIFCSPLOWO2_01_FULL_42_11]|uniref:Uncharacterized protein n=1 Tax=candidate division WWE3 bacterium RIFCSPLOWO2_01_FULL_42_11 TaxID=1802627 RepID=A0A1F4VQJ2_UNCKA|nr:MAG: hypothetical protein A3A70_00655 [candidate division WWE3 bacterium RIFCSPLOWO2_01_FULL_42_11]